MHADTPDWVAELRDQIPAAKSQVYLNTGTAGPLPEPVAQAMREAAARDHQEGRGTIASFGQVFAMRERVRAQLARLLGAAADEIALVHHSSEAINLVLGGLDWRPGDRVVTTSLEHDAAVVPLGVLRQRYGVEVVIAEIGLGEAAAAGLAQALAGGARLVIFSHGVYSSGALLDAAPLIGLARQAGAQVLIDGAQTCGVMPLDLEALGPDYYTLSGQKWLCGPEGAGALYVRRDRVDALRPVHASYFSAKHHDFRGGVAWHASARRFEDGMFHRPVMAGFQACLDWTLDRVGVARAWARSCALAASLRARLAASDGVVILTPAGCAGPLLSFDLPAFSPAQLHSLVHLLAGQGIVVRSIDHPPYALRAACGTFNTEGDLDRLVESIDQALRAGPGAVPLAGWAENLPRER